MSQEAINYYIRWRSARYTRLIPPEQVPRVDLALHVGELGGPAVGDDDVAARLEALEVVGDLAAEELGVVEGGLVDEHGHALGLDALHDALDGAGAEVVAAALHLVSLGRQ